MRVVVSAYGVARGVELVVGRAVRLRAPERVRVWAPSDGAAAEGCGAPVATGVVPTGGWR